MSDLLPLPPAAEIRDLVAGVNQLYSETKLARTEVHVTSATFTVDDYDEPVYLILLVTTGFQKTIEIGSGLPVGSRVLIKDISGNAGSNMIIVQPLDELLIDGRAETALINVPWGSLLLIVTPEGLYTVGRFYVASQYFDSLIMFENSIDESVTIFSASNGLSVGPLTISAMDRFNRDVVVTVQDGSRWAIV